MLKTTILLIMLSAFIGGVVGGTVAYLLSERK